MVAEYGSPHGGSWLDLLTARGLVPAGPGGQADVIIDCFGLMHAADQRQALAERAARIAPGGVLLLQYHALSTIIGRAAVERAPARALRLLLDHRAGRHAGGGGLQPAHRLAVRSLRRHRAAGRHQGRRRADGVVRALLAEDARIGVRDPGAFAGLQQDVDAHAKALHDWLAAQRSAGRKVLGYGAASRAVALLCQARVDRTLLPAVVDASPAKQGLRMPGTDIPVAGPARLAADRPDAVLLFVPDLLPEVRAAYPGSKRRAAAGSMLRHCARPPAAGPAAGPGTVPG